MQELARDAAIEPHAARDLLHVCAALLAQVRHFVDESDFVAKKALDAYLMSSAARRPVNRNGVSLMNNGR
jgi:hypothetical protein